MGGFRDKFYKMKASALGVNIVQDTLIMGSGLNDLKKNVKNALEQSQSTEYDFTNYPIKNSMLELEDSSGKKLLGNVYSTVIPKKNLPKR
jgi:purine nucleoside phosphorylase